MRSPPGTTRARNGSATARRCSSCLDVFERMLSSATFESDEENPMTGLEVELNLVDEQRQPSLGNVAVLEEIADPAFQTELGAATTSS